MARGSQISLDKWLKTNPVEPDPAHMTEGEKLAWLAEPFDGSAPALPAGESFESRQFALRAYAEANLVPLNEARERGLR
ncbi:MAG: hypothetical protein WA721_07645 [Candidatus Binataceae bacterium]